MLKRSHLLLQIAQMLVLLTLAQAVPPSHRGLIIFGFGMYAAVTVVGLCFFLFSQYQLLAVSRILAEYTAQKTQARIEHVNVMLLTMRVQIMPIVEPYATADMMRRYTTRVDEVQETQDGLVSEYQKLLSGPATSPIRWHWNKLAYELITQLFEVLESQITSNLDRLLELNNDMAKLMQLAERAYERATTARATLSVVYDLMTETQGGVTYRALEEQYLWASGQLSELVSTMEARNYITALRLCEEVIQACAQIKRALRAETM